MTRNEIMETPVHMPSRRPRQVQIIFWLALLAAVLAWGVIQPATPLEPLPLIGTLDA